jgi:FkbM family methyltransferase
VTGKYRTWVVSIVHPRDRLLPGLGARLGRHPRVAAAVLGVLRSLPTRRLRALAYRNAAQPLVQRMDTELLVRAVGGVSVIADPPDPSGRALAATGLWEWNVGAAIRQNLESGDVFVDVGANAGYYTVLSATIVGPRGHVYALEPAAATYRKLTRNVAINACDNVTALCIAAGAATGEATLYGPALGHDATSSLRHRPEAATATTVPVRPLHAVISAEHRSRLKLVKVDVEGHEDDVLRGLEPLLEQGSRPNLIVEVHALHNAEAPAFVASFCDRHGFRAHWLVEDRDSDENVAPVDRRLALRDLGAPPDLASVPRERYALLLTHERAVGE